MQVSKEVYCKIHEEIIAIKVKFLGEEAPSLADNHFNLGLEYRKQGKKKEALSHIMKAYCNYMKNLKSPHPKRTLCRLYMDKIRYS